MNPPPSTATTQLILDTCPWLTREDLAPPRNTDLQGQVLRSRKERVHLFLLQLREGSVNVDATSLLFALEAEARNE